MDCPTLLEPLLPSSEIIIHALDKIIKAFEDRIQVELIKVRWEEIKKLRSSRLTISATQANIA